ncbi:adenylate/guanylate cyclase domain-containing protein [candidate division CSSED10-310 bacterium]|uniref:Adenylate/guanylate cyclase domain-containing protein n=1 Tax=candidate division CSSED10-310 bacterium TaxID=2855610 RepID=A0ABV6Z1K7_UNCC1
MSATEKIKLLLVDDDAFICEYLQSMLECMEFDVAIAMNGKEGAEKALAHEFNMIISDINMPVMSGIELIREVRKQDTEIPIIILTGNDDAATAIESMREGAFDYIFKDDNIQESLPIAIEKALDKQRLTQENKRLLRDLQQKNIDLEETNKVNLQLLERVQSFNKELTEKIAEATAELRVTNRLLNQKVEELNALHEVGQVISSIIPVNQLLEMIMDRSKDLMKAEVSSLMIIDAETHELVFQVAQGEAGEVIKKIRIKIDENSIAGWVAKNEVPLIVADAYSDPRFNPEYDKKSGFRTKSIMCSPLRAKSKVIGVVQVINKISGESFTEHDLDIFGTFAHQASIAIENARLYADLAIKADDLRESLERERRIAIEKEKMGKFIPKTVLDEIRKSREEHLALGGRCVQVSVLFADIVGFTSISESQKPEVIVADLNKYMTAMTQIIEHYEGIVDKFIGDGIMAIFSPGNEADNHSLRAVMAAIDMQRKVHEISAEWSIGNLEIRVGVNTGEMVAGNVGSDTRMDYTVIGDNVNLASRLETACPPGCVLMSDSTFVGVQNNIPTEKIEPIQVKNRIQPVQPYLVTRSVIEGDRC